MTRRIVIVLAAVMALVLPATAASAATTWTRSATPNRGTIASVLQDVTMVPGTSTAWAVGYYYDNNVAAYRTMTQRYNGTSWGIVSSPNPSGNGYSQLNKVDATAANNVWAVGYDSQTGTLVERYNGTQWSTVTPPSGISVRGLDVVSSTSVWVAGYSGSTGTISQWTGSGWVSRYTLPPIPGRHLAVFEGIAVGPNGDVWAVGWDRDYNAPGRATAALIVHRDSQGNWSRQTAKNVATRDTLMDATVLPNGEVFAAGVAQNVSGGITQQALLLRRSGSTWSAVTVPPAEPGAGGQLQSVAAVSNTSVWAVGYYTSPSSGLLEPWLVQWTGTASTGAAPDLGTSATLWGVAATSTGNLWAVGYTAPPGAGNGTLALRGTP